MQNSVGNGRFFYDFKAKTSRFRLINYVVKS